jgi:hypothetical protein
MRAPSMELSIISLSDRQRDPATSRQIEPWRRLTPPFSANA